MSANAAPPPTREEVLTVFRQDDRVFSAADVAARIYQLRGGTKHPNDISRRERRALTVRPPQPTRVKQLLIEMVGDGTLMSREGYEANELGAVWGNPRPNGVYFASRESAENSIAERDRLRLVTEKTQSLVAVLAASPDVSGKVTSLSPSGTEIVITLSVAQACEMFGVPRDDWY